MKDNRKVSVFSLETDEKIGDYESLQRANIRLGLSTGSSTYRIINLKNKDGSRRSTLAKRINKRVYIKDYE